MFFTTDGNQNHIRIESICAEEKNTHRTKQLCFCKW